MDPRTNEANSPSSPVDSEPISKEAKAIAWHPDGRALYRLPNGATVVLSPQRQAKKLIMEKERLSARQYRKERKRRVKLLRAQGLRVP